ncbi:MAG: ATP-binding cassette domain-containing protein [Bifidobacteriaceae bacterium]|jgi:ABC-type sugar transport system ATPase subunit|nr:ATP-binding cassette domain-containing protein [Bifidobacteriaceae bacterium]
MSTEIWTNKVPADAGPLDVRPLPNRTDPVPTAPSAPVLSLRRVSKTFGRVRALDTVDFDIFAHEVVGVVGDNAAGKSVLAKVIAGIHQPDSGELYLDGKPITIPSPSAAHGVGIAAVFQELALCDNLDVVSNLFLGRELVSNGRLDETAMERITAQVLGRIGARMPPVRTKVAGLSGGQRQSTAVARAMLGSPRVVVLDEPTSSLSIAQTAEVLNLVEHLRDSGHGVMMISHSLADIQAVADRLVVMRHGRINGEAPMTDVSYEDIIAAITGVPNELTRDYQARALLREPL